MQKNKPQNSSDAAEQQSCQINVRCALPGFRPLPARHQDGVLRGSSCPETVREHVVDHVDRQDQADRSETDSAQMLADNNSVRYVAEGPADRG